MSNERQSHLLGYNRSQPIPIVQQVVQIEMKDTTRPQMHVSSCACHETNSMLELSADFRGFAPVKPVQAVMRKSLDKQAEIIKIGAAETGKCSVM